MSDVRRRLSDQGGLAMTTGKLINEMGDPVGSGNWAAVAAIYEVGIALLDKLDEILDELKVDERTEAIGFRLDPEPDTDNA